MFFNNKISWISLARTPSVVDKVFDPLGNWSQVFSQHRVFPWHQFESWMRYSLYRRSWIPAYFECRVLSKSASGTSSSGSSSALSTELCTNFVRRKQFAIVAFVTFAHNCCIVYNTLSLVIRTSLLLSAAASRFIIASRSYPPWSGT